MTKGGGTGKNSGSRAGRNGPQPLENLLRGLPEFAGQTLIRAAGQSGNFIDRLLQAPEQMEQIGKAGRYLKDLREVAGLTIDDLADAIDLDNGATLKAIEEGRSPITTDILFRLASFYARNDPLSFVLDFSREYVPWLWQLLRITGMERLAISLERELKFINIYRSRDRVRSLSPEDFDKVLGFTDKAFEMALDFISQGNEERSTDTTKRASPKQATENTGRKTTPRTDRQTPVSRGQPRKRSSSGKSAKTGAARSRKPPVTKASDDSY